MSLTAKQASRRENAITIAERRQIGSEVMRAEWLKKKIAAVREGAAHQDELLLYARPATRDRFWQNVEPRDDGCQIFNKTWQVSGYGRFSYCYFSYNAHRVMALWYLGFCGPEMHACHRCENKACVAPEHIYWGTAQQNAEDRVRDCAARLQYRPRGEDCEASKLNEKQVRSLWDEYWVDGVSRLRLGKKYNVSEATIGAIVQGKNWAHITSQLFVPDVERRPRKIPDNVLSEFFALHDAGKMPTRAIARYLGISESLGRYYLRKRKN